MRASQSVRRPAQDEQRRNAVRLCAYRARPSCESVPSGGRLGTSFDEANRRMLATFLPSEEARKKEEKTKSSQFTTVVCYARAQQKIPGCKKNQHGHDTKYDKTHPLQP